MRTPSLTDRAALWRRWSELVFVEGWRQPWGRRASDLARLLGAAALAAGLGIAAHHGHPFAAPSWRLIGWVSFVLLLVAWVALVLPSLTVVTVAVQQRAWLVAVCAGVCAVVAGALAAWTRISPSGHALSVWIAAGWAATMSAWPLCRPTVHRWYAVGITGWAGYARLARAQVLKAKELEFVLAAKSLGASHARIVVRHLLPNILQPVLIQATIGMAGAILAEATLSFLGLGVLAPLPSWGSMLNDARSHLFDAPHMVVFPALAVMLAVLAFNLLGDAWRDWLDPRTRAQITAMDPTRP